MTELVRYCLSCLDEWDDLTPALFGYCAECLQQAAEEGRVIDGFFGPPPPSAPARHPPGSEAKVRAMQARVERGESAFHPGDRPGRPPADKHRGVVSRRAVGSVSVTPWGTYRAKIKRAGVQYHLGCYRTRRRAEEAVRLFCGRPGSRPAG